MDKSVSLVLSQESSNYRKLAQDWYGLTDHQMVGMDVHHNPARCEGGRNIPEHLYIYHNTLHYAVHGEELVRHARAGGKLGGKKAVESGQLKQAAALQPREVRVDIGNKLAKWNKQNEGKNKRNSRKEVFDSRSLYREFYVYEKITERKIGSLLGILVAEPGITLSQVSKAILVVYGRSVPSCKLARLVAGEGVISHGVSCAIGLRN